MLKTVAAFAAVMAATALVAPTVGQAQELASATVSYADLQLGSPVGQQILMRRINHAAEDVCQVGLSRDYDRVQAADRCRIGAVADARPAYFAAIESARHGTVTVLDTSALIVTAH